MYQIYRRALCRSVISINFPVNFNNFPRNTSGGLPMTEKLTAKGIDYFMNSISFNINPYWRNSFRREDI